MISFEEAFQNVLDHPLNLGNEQVTLLQSTGRILAEVIKADRDFPPFDRSTKDGIAIHFSAIEQGNDRFKIVGTLSAGMAQQTLSSDANCFEIMTGAVLPKAADTIVMYEETAIKDGWAILSKTPKKGQNIHRQGSDEKAGAVLLEKGRKITAAVIGVLASVGKTEVLVKKLPKVCVVSTGNELVEVSETPLPHQIRKSNMLSLTAALEKIKIFPTQLHLADDRTVVEKKLQKALAEFDVLMLSGGVSKGKFDFIPDALEALGVEKIFHRVSQRPGKPFWFGIQIAHKKVVFSFPGNPVSTFANYHVYFLPWLSKTLGIEMEKQHVILDETVQPQSNLTLFLQVRTERRKGKLLAKLVQGNGSGDLVSLAKTDGFICVPAGETEIAKGNAFELISCV
ncbi:molybdopterin molybdochelatase [Pricia antarctica]|uniref:Molybdopterin molybdenumtransferase n=1 Tax=Pricia antarctica TaxID=641691 RepID=A0A1G7E8H5_9FLAO|nr:molybdopterin molybdotransferase MoeA [Pricia antarctica]SDE59981.1 molybdopterin molybdochelatase [Pricia antarctica]